MWINCCCCWVTTQERDLIAITAGLPTSISATRPSFLYTYHFLFKTKQTRKKKREVRQLIKSRVSPGNQTSNLLKKLKEGRALTESLLSRLYVSTSTFSGTPPTPSPPPPPPNPHQVARVVKKGKIKNIYIWTFWRSTDVIIKSKNKCLLLSVAENKC